MIRPPRLTIPTPFSSRVAINRRTSGRIVERTQEDRCTGAQIRCAAEVTHGFVQLIFISGRGAREPNGTVLRGDPIESTGGGRGEAASLVVNRGSVAAVDEVDEEGAGRSRTGICEKAAVGVYIGGLCLFGVLWKVRSAMDRGPGL